MTGTVDPLEQASELSRGEEPSPEVVRRLVEHHREFLRFLERRVGNRAAAEDILQDAFVRGLDKLDTVRDEESVVAWFYRTLRNAVVDYRRRTDARARAMDALAAELPPEPDADATATLCACVGPLASTLKPEYAEALRRVEVDGLAVRQYADETGITAGNAAVRLFRAREALRRQVVRACGTCATHGCWDCTCAPGTGCNEKS